MKRRSQHLPLLTDRQVIYRREWGEHVSIARAKEMFVLGEIGRRNLEHWAEVIIRDFKAPA